MRKLQLLVAIFMRVLLLIIAYLLISTEDSKADYEALKLYDMILTSDRIISGKIIEIGEIYFYVNASINNSSKKEVYKIKRFRDWTCARRYDTYQLGQKLILFLKDEKTYYSILSAGGEGELPIIHDSVSIPLYCLVFPDEWKVEGNIKSDSLLKHNCKVGNKIFAGLKLSLNEFTETILRFQSYFRIDKQSQIRKCADFIEKVSDRLLVTNKSSRVLYLLCKDFYGEKEKYCH